MPKEEQMAGRPAFKKMVDYEDDELIMAINHARQECARIDLDFWDICAGIDAYFEQRRRKLEKQASGKQTDQVSS